MRVGRGVTTRVSGGGDHTEESDKGVGDSPRPSQGDWNFLTLGHRASELLWVTGQPWRDIPIDTFLKADVVSYHDCRLGFHSIKILGELLDHYAQPLPRRAQLTALSLNSGRVQDENKVSLLVGQRIDFQVIIPLNPLLGSAESPLAGRLMGGLQRLFKVHQVGRCLHIHGVPLSGGRVEEVGRGVDLQPQHKLACPEARVPVHGRPQSSGNLRRVFIPAVLCLVHIAAHRVHDGAVVPFHLAVGRRPILNSGCLVNQKQFVESTEKLVLEIPTLVRESLEGAPETREEIINRRLVGNLSRLGGKGDAFHPFGERVHHYHDILELITARGKGPRKPRCTLSMGAPPPHGT